MPSFRFLWLFLGLIVSFTALLSAKSEYKYSYIPKNVYENQVFPVTVICVSECSENIPKFTFDIVSETQPISDKPLAIHNGEDSFYTFYFKAGKVDVQIPQLYIQSDH